MPKRGFRDGASRAVGPASASDVVEGKASPTAWTSTPVTASEGGVSPAFATDTSPGAGCGNSSGVGVARAGRAWTWIGSSSIGFLTSFICTISTASRNASGSVVPAGDSEGGCGTWKSRAPSRTPCTATETARLTPMAIRFCLLRIRRVLTAPSLCLQDSCAHIQCTPSYTGAHGHVFPAQRSKSATTGAWSEGVSCFGPLRWSRSTQAAVEVSATGRVANMWSMRSPSFLGNASRR